MKYVKRVSGLLFACMILLFTTMPVMAAKEVYTYTVRIFSGAQGTIGGGEYIVYENLKYGDRVAFDRSQVELHDGSKYYIKGIRESGKDNNTVSANAFIVTGDQDYVVAYGFQGGTVAYTVNYVDEEGNELAPSETYYGNVGDEPVVAYLYIEGYQPQAYRILGRLSENEAENVFTFTYTSLADLIPPEENPQENNPQTPSQETAPGTDEGGNAPDAGTDIPDNQTPEGLNEPEELEVLPSADVPLSDVVVLKIGDVAVPIHLSTIQKGAVVLSTAALLLLAFYFLFLRKKKKEKKAE